MRSDGDQHRPLRDMVSFLRLWVRRPARLGAVAPSGRSLATAMAEQVDPQTHGAVVELGGGTGNITAALLKAGVAPDNLIVIEREQALCNLIASRFPSVRVLCGDARQLRRLLRREGITRVTAVVSGLPLTLIPDRSVRTIIDQCFSVMADNGQYIQFTYSPAPPVSRSIVTGLDIRGERADWVFDNIPPAAVWVYQRRFATVPLPARQANADRMADARPI